MLTLSHSLYFLLAFLSTLIYAQTCPPPASLFVPPTFSSAPSVAQYTSCNAGHDGPKVGPINTTSYDWWYFDAVSDDGKESIVVVFFTSSFAGFPFQFTSALDATTMSVFATFEDGTSSLNPLLGTGATITTNGELVSGTWSGAGASFTGSSDLSTYSVNINNLLGGVRGGFTLESHGPGHYPCSPLVGGQDIELIPHVGWVNVQPAARASVDFNINGKRLQFSGPAYHDKNWGDAPFSSAVNSWYWGHGTLGPYSIVFFNALDSTNTESVSGYIVDSRTGEAVGATCSGLRVRPINAPYPPGLLKRDPDQFLITMELNDGTQVNATVTKDRTQINVGGYARWIGPMTGWIGGVEYEGAALWEQFKIAL